MRAHRQSLTGRSLRAYADFDPNMVELGACGPEGSHINLDTAPQFIDGHHTWNNNNPRPESGSHHAYIEAQVHMDGQPLTIDVNEQHDFRRQVDDQTYAVLVAANGAHTVPFAIDTSSIPTGENMAYQANVTVLENRGPLGF